MSYSGGRSEYGAAGAAGLTRVGMKKARAMESEILDRAKPAEQDTALQMARRFADMRAPASNWLAEHPEVRVRPPAGTVYARQESRFRAAQEVGLVIPDIAWGYEPGRAALYTVIAMGDGVNSVAVGDVVLALAHDWGALCFEARLLGSDVWLLRAPEYRCRATAWDLSHDTENATEWVRCPDGAVRARRRPPTRVIERTPHRHGSEAARADGCGCGGDVMAIVER